MRIFLLRHAIAEPRDPRRYPGDSGRPLTRTGRARMARAARGMRALGLRFDLILTSPFARARQTAAIVLDACRPRPPLRVLRPLAPGGGTGGVVAGLASLPKDAAVLLVGHEPDLSRLAGALVLETRSDLPLEFRKGGLCRIDTAGAPLPGAGRIVLHVTPKILRRLGPRRST
jgi:phosphohistidine phosphatase